MPLNFKVVRPLRIVVALALSCLLIFTGGCSLKKLATEGNHGEELVLVTASDPSSFNYAAAQFSYLFFSFIYKGLVAENGITAELEPALAQSWGFGDDRRRITFTLRPGLKWSDGEPLTADDVVFTFQEIYLNPKIPTVYRDFLRIGGAFPAETRRSPSLIYLTRTLCSLCQIHDKNGNSARSCFAGLRAIAR